MSLNRMIQVCNRNEHWCYIVMNTLERVLTPTPAS
jgi:hypothetical protein